MVVSRTSMKVGMTTASATTQGLMVRRSQRVIERGDGHGCVSGRVAGAVVGM